MMPSAGGGTVRWQTEVWWEVQNNGPKVMGDPAGHLSEAELLCTPRVGLLHCQVASSLAPEEPYAPCTKGDLQNKGYDYWA